MKLFPSHCCQRCGENIGYIGRLFMMLMPKWHVCKDETKHLDNLGI